MKPIGIVFIFLNLALAGAFLGYISHAHDVNKNWREEAERIQGELDQETERLNRELASQRAATANAETTADQFREQRDTFKTQLDAANAELEVAKRENDELRGEISGINSTLDGFRVDIETANNLRSEAQEARVAAEQERDQAKDAAAAALLAQRNAEDAQRRTEQELADTELVLGETRAALDALQVEFDVLVAVTGTNLDDIQAVPAIPATVVDVSHAVKPGLVVLNVGKNRDVKRGMTFQIYRDGVYKGEVRVDNVDETMCSALIQLDNGIAQGDSANTQLY